MPDVSDDAGFTLTELLLALVIGLIIALAAFTVLDVTLRRAGEIGQRVDTTQRGRQLMDAITRDLRSQVCMDQDTPPIRATTSEVVGGSHQQSVSFYVDLTDGRGGGPPQLRTIRYDERARTVTEDVSEPLSTSPLRYPDVPDSSRVIGTDVVREGGTIPIFRYYGFTTSTGPSDPATPDSELPATMTGPDGGAKMVARIAVNFEVAPTGRAVGRTATVFQDDVFVRAADPNDPAPIPTCA